jgi:hypothetical protein
MNIDEITVEDVENWPEDVEMMCREQIKKDTLKCLFFRHVKNGAVFSCTECGFFGAKNVKFKHDQITTCPVCKKHIRTYSAGYGKDRLSHERSYGLCYELNDLWCIRVVTARIAYLGDFPKEPRISIAPNYVYIFSKKKAVRYIYRGRYNYEKGRYIYTWEKMSRVNCLPTMSMFRHNDYSDTVPLNTESYKKTALKYCAPEIMSESVNQLILYLKLWQRHKNVEYLAKQGFGNLIEDMLKYTYKRDYINWKSNNLLKMLGIGKNDLEFCKVMTFEQLEFFKELKASDGALAEPLIMYFRSRIRQAENIHKKTGLSYRQIRNYLEKQGGIYLIQWMSDYCDMSVDCMGHVEELRQKDIRTAHDRMTTKLQFHENAKYNARMHERCKKLKKLCMSYGDLIMKPPESSEDIIIEGSILHHCVGGYVARHAEGKTNILFIRKKTAPDTPFFTVEVSNELRIIQCHGYRNEAENPKPEEIKSFEEAYNEFLKKIKENSKWTA